jgi:hypothetical protein
VLSSGKDILAAVVISAKEFVIKELGRSQFEKIWLDDGKFHTMDAFLDTLSQVQKTYETRSSANKAFHKTQTWLASLSGRVLYYGNILDVLVHQCSKYLSLIWGAFKFLFVIGSIFPPSLPLLFLII